MWELNLPIPTSPLGLSRSATPSHFKVGSHFRPVYQILDVTLVYATERLQPLTAPGVINRHIHLINTLKGYASYLPIKESQSDVDSPFRLLYVGGPV